VLTERDKLWNCSDNRLLQSFSSTSLSSNWTAAIN
jgi:hypothetical protein